MYLLIGLIVSSILVPATYYCGNICPPGNANNIHDVISRPGTVHVQQGIWHRVFCPEFRAGEALDGLVWYKGSSKDSAVYLIGVFEGRTTIRSNRHELSTNFSLVIKGVESTDQGSYLCDVLPTNTITRLGKVDLSVIGTRFPPVGNPASTNRESFERDGGRHTLQCQCAPRAPGAGISIVYWSAGEGISMDTHIIGAHFADGSVLQIQHGASYSIGSDLSLAINSPHLVNVHDGQRFWCHVFKSDDTRSTCNTDVTITGEPTPDHKLRASRSSFYLPSGNPAILPCTSLEPGDPACDVQWFKVNNPDRHLLTYNLSTGDLKIESGFDLAGNFGMFIRTVDESSAGRYRCDIDGGHIVGEAIDVLVIGNNFPLDGGDVTKDEPVNLKPNMRLTLKCPVRFSTILVNKTTIFWSFGALDEQQSTTVIGNLVLPKGIRTIFDLGDNGCYGISYEGSLVLTNCSQNNDVRYWCHVFKEGDVLQRSYVDVTVDGTSSTNPASVTTTIVTICVILLFCAVVVFVSVCLCRRNISCRRDVERRGRHKPVEIEGVPLKDVIGSVSEKDVKKLVPKVKRFYVTNMVSIPISSWVTWDEDCYQKIDDVFIAPEMFVNVDFAGSTIKYRVDPKTELFEDGTLKSCQNVLISGRAGCGKTTFLYKLAYDWAMGRQCSLFGDKTFVFLLSINSLRKSGSLGKSVVNDMLSFKWQDSSPKRSGSKNVGQAERFTQAINNYCSQYPNEVAVLIDGCTEKEHLQHALNMLQSLRLTKCQTVIASRCSKTAHDISRKHKMRHATITGFKPQDVHKYINKVFGVKEKENTKHDQDSKRANPSEQSVNASVNTGNGQNDKGTVTASEATTVGQPHSGSSVSETLKSAEEQPPDPEGTDVCSINDVAAKLHGNDVETQGENCSEADDTANYDIITHSEFNESQVSQKSGDKSENTDSDSVKIQTKSKDQGTEEMSEVTDSPNEAKDPGHKIPKEGSTVDCYQTATSSESPKKSGINGAKKTERQASSTNHDEGENARALLLRDYINDAILPPKVTCLPGNLTALCRLSLWTHGEVFRSKPTMAELCTKLVIHMFERSRCTVEDGAYNQTCKELELVKGWEECLLSGNQLHILIELGRVVQPIFFDNNYEGPVTFHEYVVLQNCLVGREVVDVGKKCGMLCQEQDAVEDPEVRFSDETTPFIPGSPECCKIGFALEILQEFCIGIYMSFCEKDISTWAKQLESVDVLQNVSKLQNVFVFASQPQSSESTRSKLVDIVSKARNKAMEVVKLQDVIELCLQIYCEATPTDSTRLRGVIEDKDQVSRKIPVVDVEMPVLHKAKRNIRMLGVSTHKIHLLLHFLRNNEETKMPDKSSGRLRCIELFRVGGSFDFAELQDFVKEGLPQQGWIAFLKSKYRFYGSTTTPVHILGEGITPELATRLRKRISSSEDDLPKFPSDRSDMEVLVDIQSYGVLDLLESQASECCSPSAAKELVQSLLCQEKLEEVVIMGTILSSPNVVDLANNLDKLGNLTKLDLRLNRHFDDSAFGAITAAVGKSTKLTDLRLSLYEVTEAGFEDALRTMEKTNKSWGRLKTLYLVHGNPAKKFVWFLTQSLKYFDEVAHFYVSSSVPDESVPESDLDGFEKEFGALKRSFNPLTMHEGKLPNLKRLDCGNMDKLRERSRKANHVSAENKAPFSSGPSAIGEIVE